jgi:preprotein translocase SecE subunit
MPTKKKGKESGDKGASPASSNADSTNGEKVNLKAEKAEKNVAKIAAAGQPPDDKPRGSKKTDGGKSGGDGGKAGAPKAKPNKKGEEEGTLAATTTDIRQFLKEVAVEFRKITWPDRDTVLRETWGVLLLVGIITGLVLGFDWMVAHFIFQPLEHLARQYGGGIGRF